MKSILLFSFVPAILIILSNHVNCQSYETTIARRERNLDHWDAETLAAYLSLDPDTAEPLEDGDNYVAIDAAIMFYAQWCTNCHQFASVWDTIAQLIPAGTTKSNLIMSLFNCELNEQHTELCIAAGVTHYPTLMYVGPGPIVDSDPFTSTLVGKNRAAGPFGATKLPRTAKFQGNLNIGDSVLDWVKAMMGLSTWYKWNHMDDGWLKGIRSFFSIRKAPAAKSLESALPVGVPPRGKQSSLSYSSSSSTYTFEKTIKKLEQELDSKSKELELEESATKHGGYLINSFLFPELMNQTDEDGNMVEEPIDIFTEMNRTNAWDYANVGNGADDEIVIMAACLVDLTLDYCTRLSTKATEAYLDSITSLSDSEYPTFIQMEQELRGSIEEQEPYCSIFSSCFDDNFNDTEVCRPTKCPFNSNSACIYVSACLSEDIQVEYREALNQMKATEFNTTHTATEESSTTTTASARQKSSGAGAWGMKN